MRPNGIQLEAFRRLIAQMDDAVVDMLDGLTRSARPSPRIAREGNSARRAAKTSDGQDDAELLIGSTDAA
jgi:hypothetical protein